VTITNVVLSFAARLGSEGDGGVVVQEKANECSLPPAQNPRYAEGMGA
jgi:hypothetical protein